MNNQIQLVLKSSTTELSLNDHELGIYLVPELDGLTGLPEIRTTSGVNSGYDGGWTSAQHYDARSITIRGVIANTDVATVERLRKQLVSLAGQGKQEELTLDLVTEAGNAYTLQVRTIALEMAMKGVLEKQEFMLQLRADDPLIYDNAESTHEAYIQVSKATGGFTINFDLPLAITGGSEETVISNDGLEQVPTITRLYGELHNPKIINQTTNQSMQINADLGFSEGQWVDASEVVSGKDITINDAPEGAPFNTLDLKGNTEQTTYSGKNLYPLIASTTSNGITYTQNADGTYNISGTSTAQANAVLWLDDISAFVDGQTYTISVSPAPTNMNVLVEAYNGTTWQRTLFDANATNPIKTSAINMANANRLKFSLRVQNGYTVNLQNLKIQLEKSSSATAWERYVGGTASPNPDYPQPVQTVTGENVVKISDGQNEQSYEINLGKNLFDKDNANILSAYIDSGQQTITSNNNNRIMWIRCEPSTTYTITKTPVNYQRGIAYTKELPTSGVQTYGYYSGQNNWGNLSFTTGADAKYIVIRIWVVGQDSASLDDMLASVQIEKGSKATSYAAYFEPIELCKIGDYQDYIYKSGGDWYIHKATGKYTFTTNETITYQSNFPRFMVGFVHGQNSTTQVTAQAKCSHYVVGQTASIDGTFGIAPNVIYIHNNAITSGDDLKTWFGNNNVSVYFVLATPTDTEITNEALIAQLETLLNTARTYAGVNNIFTVTPNEQGTLEISYYTHKTADNRDEIVIDSRLRTVTLNGLDIYHLIETGSEFLMLAPGENKLSLQSDITGDNGYAEVSYKQGYLSI